MLVKISKNFGISNLRFVDNSYFLLTFLETSTYHHLLLISLNTIPKYHEHYFSLYFSSHHQLIWTPSLLPTLSTPYLFSYHFKTATLPLPAFPISYHSRYSRNSILRVDILWNALFGELKI